MVHKPFDTRFSTSLPVYFIYGTLQPYIKLNVKLLPTALTLFGGMQIHMSLSRIKTKINILLCHVGYMCYSYKKMRTVDTGTVCVNSYS